MLLRSLVAIRTYIISLLEALLVASSFTLAVFICFPIEAATYLEYEGGYWVIGLITGTYLLASYLLDFYREPNSRSRIMVMLQVAQLIGTVLLMQAAIAFLNRDLVARHPIMLVGSGLTMLVIVPWRLYVRPKIWRAIGAQRVIFVGWDDTIRDLSEAYRTEPDRGMEVVGFIAEPGTPVEGRLLGVPQECGSVLADTAADIIIVGAGVNYKPLLRALLERRAMGAGVQTAGQAYELAFSRVDCRSLHPYGIVFTDDLQAPRRSVALQSIYNNLLGLAATIIAFPLLVVIAILLRITSRGPIMTSYTCIGLHGIPFNLYRFQTPVRTKGFFHTLLVRYRLAGLPQVLNIIRGELALLGPRPERAEFDHELHEMLPYYKQKQSVKPGVFGWSQMHCDAEPDEDTLRRLEYDLYYIKHISVALDLYIVLQAVKRVMSSRRPEHDGVGIAAAAS